MTPDIHKKMSKRAFDGVLRKWRRQLHDYDDKASATPSTTITVPSTVTKTQERGNHASQSDIAAKSTTNEGRPSTDKTVPEESNNSLPAEVPIGEQLYIKVHQYLAAEAADKVMTYASLCDAQTHRWSRSDAANDFPFRYNWPGRLLACCWKGCRKVINKRVLQMKRFVGSSIVCICLCIHQVFGIAGAHGQRYRSITGAASSGLDF